MKKLIYISLILSLLYSCNEKSKTNKQETISNSQQIDFAKKIDTTINNYLDLDIFSGIVLVAKKGEILLHEAYGLADRHTKIPNTINTLFDIGSMNKTFTSIVIKQLANEGKLNLNDKLTNYIQGFLDPNVSKINIKHLLNHESGFGDYHTEGFFDLPKKEKTLQAIVNRAKKTRLYFEPGTEQEYSNLGYVILGAIIEKVSNKSYFDNVKQRIVDVLELKNTFLQNLENVSHRKAKGYYYTPLGKLVENNNMVDIPNPDGGFLSTTEDIMKFYRSYYYDTILLTEEMKENDPYFQYYKTLPAGKATGAFGGFEGFNTALYQVLSDDLTIIVFANMDEPVAENIAKDILSLYRNEKPKKPKLPAVQSIRIAFEKKGLDYIKNNFEDLTTNYHPEDPKDFILNTLGYAYLYEVKDINKALSLFKLNTNLFPESANVWDSYGEALKQNKNNAKAVSAYNKALELDPKMESAREALLELNNK